MSLRQQCLDAIYPFMDGDYGNEKWTSDCLAALLDVLEANTDEDGWIAFIDSDGEIGVDLIDALRDSVGVEVDQ